MYLMQGRLKFKYIQSVQNASIQAITTFLKCNQSIPTKIKWFALLLLKITEKNKNNIHAMYMVYLSYCRWWLRPYIV